MGKSVSFTSLTSLSSKYLRGRYGKRKLSKLKRTPEASLDWHGTWNYKSRCAEMKYRGSFKDLPGHYPLQEASSSFLYSMFALHAVLLVHVIMVGLDVREINPWKLFLCKPDVSSPVTSCGTCAFHDISNDRISVCILRLSGFCTAALAVLEVL